MQANIYRVIAMADVRRHRETREPYKPSGTTFGAVDTIVLLLPRIRYRRMINPPETEMRG